MGDTFKAFLAPMASSNGETIKLVPGSNIVGRGSEFGINDRRVSRKHAEIIVNPQTATVTIEPLGVNPTILQRKASPKKQLPNNEREVLMTGDTIIILDFHFNVIIVDEGISKMSMGTGTIGSDQDATQLDVDAFNDDDSEEESTTTEEEKKNNNTIVASAPAASPASERGGKRKADGDPDSLAKRMKTDSVQIAPQELRYIRQLGLGSCGEVWECEWRGTKVATKKIFRSLLHADAMREFLAEANILSHLRHPNIVLFMGTCIQEKDMAIVTEFMSRGSLRDVLNSAKLDLRMILKIAHDAATGMNYLHTYNPPIIHRDLKSMNLLVDNNFNVKVSDFGLAKFTTKNIKATTFCGTLQWIAPELLRGVGYTTQVDVYSYGVVLWELITRGEPYKGLNQASIIAGINDGMRPQIPADCPVAFAQLIRDCWQSDPQLRPSFGDIIPRIRQMESLLPPASPVRALNSSTAGTLHQTNGTNNNNTATNNNPNAKFPWEIDVAEVEIVPNASVLQSASSRVYRAKYRGHDVVLKELVRNNEKREQDQLLEFKKEVEVLNTVKSPLVVFFYGAILKPSLSLVMEWMDCSLFDLMKNQGITAVWNWALVSRLALGAAKAVNALHCWKPTIIHRKLKGTSLLVDTSLHVKVSGFGLARFKTPEAETAPQQANTTSSIVYKAPEVLKSQQHSTESDVYGLSVVFWELATRCAVGSYQFPFAEHQNFQTEANFIQAVNQGLRPSLQGTIPQSLKNIICKCWDTVPSNRPSLAEVIPTLEGIVKELSAR